jgi:hypothetical protein
MGQPVTLSQTVQGSSSNWLDSASGTISGIFDAISSGIEGVYQVKQALNGTSSQLSSAGVLNAVTSSPTTASVPVNTTGQSTAIAAIAWILVFSFVGLFIVKSLKGAR